MTAMIVVDLLEMVDVEPYEGKRIIEFFRGLEQRGKVLLERASVLQRKLSTTLRHSG
jgi:hypothetical protein